MIIKEIPFVNKNYWWKSLDTARLYTQHNQDSLKVFDVSLKSISGPSKPSPPTYFQYEKSYI